MADWPRLEQDRWSFGTEVKMKEWAASLREQLPGLNIALSQEWLNFERKHLVRIVVQTPGGHGQHAARHVFEELADEFPSDGLMAKLRLLLQ
jgi:hypothetical protein